MIFLNGPNFIELAPAISNLYPLKSDEFGHALVARSVILKGLVNNYKNISGVSNMHIMSALMEKMSERANKSESSSDDE